MAMSDPAILSSTMLARKGAAVPTGYTPMRSRDIRSTRDANRNSGGPPPITNSLAGGRGGSTSTEGERSRVSVRLDRERHLKLKLTAAHLDSSLQDVMTDALDRYLEQLGPEVLRNDCACLGMKDGGETNGAAQLGWPSV